MPEQNPPAGFESHWDAPWFYDRAAECRRIAELMGDGTLRTAMAALADDFQAQSEHAKVLASIALGLKTP